jgi:S-DNA-T family DNA segregation ATPase FtsK/SpoIIIE
MQNGGASVSYLQRRLSIGYSRAARIIDQMEDKGYIAGATGSKVRKVLITPDQFYEEFGEAYDNID